MHQLAAARSSLRLDRRDRPVCPTCTDSPTSAHPLRTRCTHPQAGYSPEEQYRPDMEAMFKKARTRADIRS